MKKETEIRNQRNEIIAFIKRSKEAERDTHDLEIALNQLEWVLEN